MWLSSYRTVRFPSARWPAIEAAQVEKGVQEHRAMTCGEHEAVAVRPVGIPRVEAQVLRKEIEGIIGGPHRQAGVAGPGLLDGVDGQRLEGVDRQSGQLGALGCGRHGYANSSVAGLTRDWPPGPSRGRR